MKNSQKGFIVPLLMVIAVLVIGAGAYYFGFKKNNNIVTSEIPVNSESQSQIIVDTSNSKVSSTTAQATSTFPVQSNIETDIKITGTALQTVNCGSTDCFTEKFTTCSPATFDASMGSVTFHYEIIKPVANGCQLSMKFTRNPSPTWVNKLMTCTLNNKADFQSELQRVLGSTQKNTCSGPLADVIWAPGIVWGTVATSSVITTPVQSSNNSPSSSASVGQYKTISYESGQSTIPSSLIIDMNSMYDANKDDIRGMTIPIQWSSFPSVKLVEIEVCSKSLNECQILATNIAVTNPDSQTWNWYVDPKNLFNAVKDMEISLIDMKTGGQSMPYLPYYSISSNVIQIK